jgi:hypothetical protein
MRFVAGLPAASQFISKRCDDAEYDNARDGCKITPGNFAALSSESGNPASLDLLQVALAGLRLTAE